MNALIESLNVWGARFLDFAPPILWQSSLLMAFIFGFDLLLRRKIRPIVRYTLWFVVFVKLLLPPTLALPTGAAWWLRGRPVAPQRHAKMLTASYREPSESPTAPLQAIAPRSVPKPTLSRDAWILVGSVTVSVLLFAWAIFRWLQIARWVRKTTAPSDNILQMLEDARHLARVRQRVALRLTSEAMSPAVCGLFRPVILLPQSLINGLSEKQLRAVLLHELIHLRRCDVWMNCAQTLLQIVYWWHPLLWFANARVRRLREESVDDAVMLALNDEAEIYAPTLLEVAKLAFNRPLAALGLVGILESRNALRHRIERLLNFTTPRRAGLSVVSLLCIATFTAVAVPMGEPPAHVAESEEPIPADALEIKSRVLIQARFYQLRPKDSAQIKLESASLHREANSTPWRLLLPDQITDVQVQFIKLGANLFFSPQVQTFNNAQASMFMGDGTNNIRLDCTPLVRDGVIELTTLVRTTGTYAPDGKGWPDLGDKTNCAIYARMNIPSGDGVLLRAEHAGTTADNLIILLTAKIVEPAPFLGDLPGVGHLFRSGTNVTTTNTSPATVANDPVKTFLADGKLLYQLGKLDEAETKLNRVLIIQPANQAALYYLGLIKRQRIRAVVDAQNGAGPKVIPNPNTHTNASYSSVARQKIYDKLNTIRFDKVSFPGLTLAEVIRNLRTETQQRDPDQEGINFVLNQRQPPVLDAAGQPATFDPATGQPIVAAKSAEVDVGTVMISLDPSLQNVRLMDVLEAIVKTADHPIKYSLLDYGIEFSLKGPEQPELRTRTFKVDPNPFYIGLQNTGSLKTAASQTTGGGSTGATRSLKYGGYDSTIDIQMAVINFFNEVGVNLSAPKSVFFNDRQGTLTVHATADDLDLIEQAISTLNTPSGSIVESDVKAIPASAVEELHTRTFKVDTRRFYIGSYQSGVFTNYINRSKSSAGIQSTLVDAFRKAGVDLSAPKSLFFDDSKSSLTISATDADLNLLENLINKWSTPPPEVTVKVRFIEVDADNKSLNALLGGILTNAPVTSSNSAVVFGILTQPMFKSVLQALEKRDHADLLNEGRVTTLSGRQANFQVIDINPDVNIPNTPYGTTVDVVPFVSADGYTVQMTVIPSVIEFLGYEDSAKVFAKVSSQNGDTFGDCLGWANFGAREFER